MSEGDRTIRGLSKQEREYVIKTFARRIGASKVLDGKAWKVIPQEEVLEALGTGNWPGPITSPIELAWTSESLDHADFRGLKGYSIFWQRTEHALEMWIGRYPVRPLDNTSILADGELVSEILTVYRVYLSKETRAEHLKLMVKWWFRRSAITVVPLVLGLVLVATLVFQNTGVSYRSAFALLSYLLGAALMHYATKLFGQMSAPLIVAASLLLLVVYLQVRAEHASSLALNDTVFGACLLVGVVAAQYRDPYTIGDVLMLSGWDRVRRLYEGSIRTTSVVTIVTYSVFRLAEYTIINIKWDSSLVLLPLVPMAIVAVAEFLRREIERR